MAEKAVTTGVLIVLFTSFVVFAIELFLPLSARNDMNTYCRNTLLRMESMGGLAEDDKTRLRERLEERGFSNISIYGSNSAKHGEEMNLRVEVEFSYNKLGALLVRSMVIQKMVYEKSAISRRIVN